MYAQSHTVHWTQEYDQEEGLHELLHCCAERYKIIATPISNKLTEFEMKK